MSICNRSKSNSNSNSNTTINDYIQNQINKENFSNTLTKLETSESANSSNSVNSDEINNDNTLISKLEVEFENETVIKTIKMPENYGSKWKDDEKQKLIKILKTKNDKISEDKYTITKYDVLTKIAKKLGRSEGGILFEIKKIVYERYSDGEKLENICEELNLVYKNTRMVIKVLIEQENEKQINLLEKENKLLRLKIENIKLKRELDLLSN